MGGKSFSVLFLAWWLGVWGIGSWKFDLFLEIAPVADFSASCYWQLTRVSKVALDYARPKVAAFVAKGALSMHCA